MKRNSEYDFVAIITHLHEALVTQVMIDSNDKAKKISYLLFGKTQPRI